MQRLLLSLFLLSLTGNAIAAIAGAGWSTLPALLLGWYMADLLSGLVHMYMDYRPCPPGKGLNEIFFYTGSRESDAYQALFRGRMAAISPLDRLVCDFKNHHPRPDALGRRDLWRLIGSTVMIAALPLSLALNIMAIVAPVPGWVTAGGFAMLAGGGFAQYFHGSLHRADNPAIVIMMRRVGLLMTPAAHQLHHDSLQRDFATNCGWSNPIINRVFAMLRARGYLGDAGLEPAS